MSIATCFIIQINMKQGLSTVNALKDALSLHMDHYHSPSSHREGEREEEKMHKNKQDESIPC